nr:hypothetical protein [Tanacetum cinerariifolium]
MNVTVLREILNICPKVSGKEFDESPNEEEALSFIHELSFYREISDGGGGELGGRGCDNMYSENMHWSSSLNLKSMEEEEVPLVDGVFEGALGALEDEEDGEASRFDIQREDHHFVQKKWECRMVGNQEVVRDRVLAREAPLSSSSSPWERESDEFVLNHDGEKNDAIVISWKSNLTIKSRMKRRTIGSLIS